MADVIVECSHCGKKTAVSEYVDHGMAVCPACGAKLDVPRREVIGPTAPARQEPSGQKPATPSPLERSTVTAFRAVSDRRKKFGRRRQIISWSPGPITLISIFILGTLILSLLRFVFLPPGDMAAFAKIGVLCLMVGHFTVVVDAFCENMMFGLLSLVLPGYSLFYLYTQCDSYVLRLAVGIMIIPFGMDAVKVLLITLKIVLRFFGQDIPV